MKQNTILIPLLLLIPSGIIPAGRENNVQPSSQDIQVTNLVANDEIATKQLNVTEIAFINKLKNEELTVTNNAHINGSITTHDVSITNNLTIDGNLQTNALEFNNGSIANNLTVGGELSTNHSAQIGCELNVGCNIYTPHTTNTVGSFFSGGTRWLHNFGTDNFFAGENAGNTTMTGVENIGIGTNVFSLITTGSGNLAVGPYASTNITTGNHNIMIGDSAGSNLTSGASNIAIGGSAGNGITSESNNILIAHGGIATENNAIRIGNASHTTNYQSGINNITNTSNPDSAIVSINSNNQLNIGRIYHDIDITDTTATQGAILKHGVLWIHNYNAGTFVGLLAGNRTLTGLNNTGLGGGALHALTTGGFNTAIGSLAGITLTTGFSNTVLGYAAGENITKGNTNIAIGFLAGQNITTGSNNVLIGNAGASAAESNTIRIGNSSHTAAYISPNITTTAIGAAPVHIDGNGQLLKFTSSRRFKKNITQLSEDIAEKFLTLAPVAFNDIKDETNKTIYGFIAEDVNEIMPELVIYDNEGLPLSITYSMFYALLLKLVQNNRALIQQLQTKVGEKTEKGDSKIIKSLKSELINYANRLTTAEQTVNEQQSIIKKLQYQIEQQEEVSKSLISDIALLKTMINTVRHK